jgi:hypothetical protein
MPLGEPLDGAEKRRSKGTVSRCSAGVPVTHASVAPFPRCFSDLRRRAARMVRCRSTFPSLNECSERDKAVMGLWEERGFQ